MKILFSENHLSESEKSKIVGEFLYEFIKICSEVKLDEDKESKQDQKDKKDD